MAVSPHTTMLMGILGNGQAYSSPHSVRFSKDWERSASGRSSMSRGRPLIRVWAALVVRERWLRRAAPRCGREISSLPPVSSTNDVDQVPQAGETASIDQREDGRDDQGDHRTRCYLG